MADKEGYDGWSNRETKTLDLWLSNNEWLCTEAARRVRLTKDKAGIEKALQEFVEGLTDAVGFGNMFDDVGDIKQVNWKELAEAWKEDEKWG